MYENVILDHGKMTPLGFWKCDTPILVPNLMVHDHYPYKKLPLAYTSCSDSENSRSQNCWPTQNRPSSAPVTAENLEDPSPESLGSWWGYGGAPVSCSREVGVHITPISRKGWWSVPISIVSIVHGLYKPTEKTQQFHEKVDGRYIYISIYLSIYLSLSLYLSIYTPTMVFINQPSHHWKTTSRGPYASPAAGDLDFLRNLDDP